LQEIAHESASGARQQSCPQAESEPEPESACGARQQSCHPESVAECTAPQPKRKPGRPPGSLNKTTIARRAATEEATSASGAGQSPKHATGSRSKAADAVTPSAPRGRKAAAAAEDKAPSPKRKRPRRDKEREATRYVSPSSSSSSYTPVRRKNKRAKTARDVCVARAPRSSRTPRVIVLSESSSDSEDYTLVKRKRARRDGPVNQRVLPKPSATDTPPEAPPPQQQPPTAPRNGVALLAEGLQMAAAPPQHNVLLHATHRDRLNAQRAVYDSYFARLR
jgi:hypothetical protein